MVLEGPSANCGVLNSSPATFDVVGSGGEPETQAIRLFRCFVEPPGPITLTVIF